MTATTPPATPSPLLRTAASARCTDDEVTVTVELHGDLCSMTAGQLRREVMQLIEEGADRLVFDLGDVRLCTTDGIAVFEEADSALADRGRGSVQLRCATGVAARVIDIIDEADPSFELDLRNR